ncbi:MAG TPA: class I SAM-dependent methyltransferase, partial [Thermomicrobiales bacterium]|nr:class I SAM-dependent methyltransferase [Thermomicrobiales bacterium]
ADAANVFGAPTTQGYRAKHRIATFQDGEVADEPNWAQAPGIAPGIWEEFSFEVREHVVPMVTQAGVFAGAKVDAGTRMLLDVLPDTIRGSVIDAGCGAGVIGIAAALSGAARVTMIDANLLAVQAARENVRRLGLAGVDVVASDAYGALKVCRYDLIVSNPPFHRGKTVDLTVADRLIAGAPAHLAPGGSLLIVANAFLSYGRHMDRVFGRVEVVAGTRQYQVFRATEPR